MCRTAIRWLVLTSMPLLILVVPSFINAHPASADDPLPLPVPAPTAVGAVAGTITVAAPAIAGPLTAVVAGLPPISPPGTVLPMRVTCISIQQPSVIIGDV